MIKKNSVVEAAKVAFGQGGMVVVKDLGKHYVCTMKEAKALGFADKVLPIGEHSPSEVDGEFIRVYDLKNAPTEDGREVVWFRGWAQNREFYGSFNAEGIVEDLTIKATAEYANGEWIDAPYEEDARLTNLVLETVQHIAF